MDIIQTELSATNIRYILIIYKISRGSLPVKCVDISNELSVSRPSVHAMIKSLSEMNIIEKSRYGKVHFTEYGVGIAQKYSEYFEAFRNYLSPLFGANNIDDAVCGFISRLSPENLESAYKNIRFSDDTSLDAAH